MQVRLLTHPDALLEAFEDLVEWADTLDLAYAWLDSANLTTDAWRMLEDRKIRRVIAGVSFGGTEPAALRYLHREVPDRVRLEQLQSGRLRHQH